METYSHLKLASQNYFNHLFVEVSISLLLIGLLTLTYLHSIQSYLARSYTSEIFLQVSPLQRETALGYFYRGEWLASNNPGPKLFEAMDWFNEPYQFIADPYGGVQFELANKYLTDKNNLLAFNLYQNPESEFSSLIWHCGYSKPLEGYQLVSPRKLKTNVDPWILPVSCR